jgi:hypothetical protein
MWTTASTPLLRQSDDIVFQSEVRSAADELLAIGRLGSVPTRKDVGRVQSCGSPPILRLVDQATTRARRPTAPAHDEQVVRQVLDDAPHGTRHTGSLGWTARPCRQLIVEAGGAHLHQRRGTKFRIRRIGGCRGGAHSPGPWSSWVRQSRSRPKHQCSTLHWPTSYGHRGSGALATR